MAKLPPPVRPLPALTREHVRRLPAATRLYRIYRAGGEHPAAWNVFRSFGPTSARFDPHTDPPRDQDRAVLYAAGDIPTAIVEAFEGTRVIDRSRDHPWLVDFQLAASVRLLDLTGSWPTAAGASQAISSDGRRDLTRAWAQAIHEEYPDVDGILYPSSMAGRRRRRSEPRLHGLAVALFERAAGALPGHPEMHLPLDHPGLGPALAQAADRYGYDLVD